MIPVIPKPGLLGTKNSTPTQELYTLTLSKQSTQRSLWEEHLDLLYLDLLAIVYTLWSAKYMKLRIGVVAFSELFDDLVAVRSVVDRR